MDKESEEGILEEQGYAWAKLEGLGSRGRFRQLP